MLTKPRPRNLGLSVIVIFALAVAVLGPLLALRGAEESSRRTTRPPGFAFTSRADAAVLDPKTSHQDQIADLVFGQMDFTHNDNPNPPTEASLDSPAAVAMDVHNGRIFVADSSNNRVLIWESMDTYQNGGPADLVVGQPDFTSNTANNPTMGGLSASSLNNPSGLVVDELGATLFVADTGNHRVLMYAEPFYDGMEAIYVLGQADFTSATVADPPSASSLRSPVGLAFDRRGNLVVVDRDNNRVLGYEWPFESGMRATYVIGQISADGFADFTKRDAPSPPSAISLNGPTGVAVGVASDRLYIADTGNNRVLAYYADRPGIAGATADHVFGQPDFASKNANQGGVSGSSLNRPGGVSVDNFDRLFVSDTGNNRVLVYTSPYSSTTATGVFGQPDLSSSSANNGGIGAASLRGPVSVAVDGENGVYIADRANHRILGYDEPLENGAPRINRLFPGTVRAGSGSLWLSVGGVGFVATSQVWVDGVQRATDFVNHRLLGVELQDGEVAIAGTLAISVTTPAPGGGTSATSQLAVFTSQPLDTVADRVLGQTDLRSADRDYIPTTEGTLYFPGEATVDRTSGRLFVADQGNNRVLGWPSATAFTQGDAADLVLGQPDFYSYESSDPEQGGRGIGATTLDFPYGVALDGNGNLYVSDGGSRRVLAYRPPFTNGMAANVVIGQPGFSNDSERAPSASGLNFPGGIALDAEGNLFVADSGNHRVLMYRTPLSTDTVPDVVFGQPNFTANTANNGGLSASSLNSPNGVALDARGNLYVVDTGNHRVLAYQAAAGDATADKVFGQPDFTSGTANNGGLSASSLNNPLGLGVDVYGNLYIADSENHRVLMYRFGASGDRTADRVFGQPDFTSNTFNNPALGGLGAASLNYPVAVAFDSANNMLVVDGDNNRLLGFDRPTEGTILYLPLMYR